MDGNASEHKINVNRANHENSIGGNFIIINVERERENQRHLNFCYFLCGQIAPAITAHSTYETLPNVYTILTAIHCELPMKNEIDVKPTHDHNCYFSFHFVWPLIVCALLFVHSNTGTVARPHVNFINRVDSNCSRIVHDLELRFFFFFLKNSKRRQMNN